MALTYRYRVWLHGLIAAILSSAGNGLTVALVDPTDFNPLAGAGWVKLGTVVLVSAIVAMGGYLKAHPLPDPAKDSDYLEAVQTKIDQITNGRGSGPLGIGLLMAAVLGGSVLVAGCASVGLRDRIVKATQSAAVSVGEFQDHEMAVYTAKALPDYTEAERQAVHAGLVRYFDAEYEFQRALLRWAPGTAVPPDLQTALREMRQALTTIRPHVPDGAQVALDYLLAAMAGVELSILLAEAEEAQ
jgi:hypothetical protein